MATKKFIIEVEEGKTSCRNCPLNGLHCGDILCSIFDSTCNNLNLATMKIKEHEDNEGKALLHAVEKTAERTKREVIEKIAKWLGENLHNYASNVSYLSLYKNLKQAMQDERDF